MRRRNNGLGGRADKKDGGFRIIIMFFSTNPPDRVQSRMCVEEPSPMIYSVKIAIAFGEISEQYGVNPLRYHFFSIDANSTIPNKWQ